MPRPRVPHWLRDFWNRAYSENVTGLAGMVAYNLMLAIFPFGLLVLFVFGRVLQGHDVEASVLRDLQNLFPKAEHATLVRTLDRVRDNSTSIGVVAAISGLWIGASFWGSLDTAFCRIYHVRCRGWVEQKRWALGMVAVAAVFMAATVIVPAVESLLLSSAGDLPFGLSDIGDLTSLLVLAGSLALTFVIGCIVYSIVPNELIPWSSVWPGALFLTACMGILNWVFPFYLTHISTIARLGNSLAFVLIALVWFYALSLSIIAGAVINALRYELARTGSVRERAPSQTT